MSTPFVQQIFSTVTATKSDRHATLPSMTVSTASVDRDGDCVMPTGGDFRNFLKNPVLCWSHSREAIPIGSVTQVAADSTGVRIQWRWLEHDPFADRVKNAWEQGVIRAASIGFLPRRSTRNHEGGVDHHAWELLEVSLCPVPANPSAVRTLKSLGLWNDDETRSGGTIDWNAINRAADIDWHGMNIQLSNRPEVDVTEDDVRRVVNHLMPAFKEGMRAGLRVQAKFAVDEVVRRMTGRLD
jgi:HK97 family phage prohead protease